MVKKKKKKDTMTGIAVSGTVGLATVGAASSLAPSSSAGMVSGFSTGVSNVGGALPIMGKVKGTTMVLSSVSMLTKKKKGGKKRNELF